MRETVSRSQKMILDCMREGDADTGIGYIRTLEELKGMSGCGVKAIKPAMKNLERREIVESLCEDVWRMLDVGLEVTSLGKVNSYAHGPSWRSNGWKVLEIVNRLGGEERWVLEKVVMSKLQGVGSRGGKSVLTKLMVSGLMLRRESEEWEGEVEVKLTELAADWLKDERKHWTWNEGEFLRHMKREFKWLERNVLKGIGARVGIERPRVGVYDVCWYGRGSWGHSKVLLYRVESEWLGGINEIRKIKRGVRRQVKIYAKSYNAERVRMESEKLGSVKEKVEKMLGEVKGEVLSSRYGLIKLICIYNDEELYKFDLTVDGRSYEPYHVLVNSDAALNLLNLLRMDVEEIDRWLTPSYIESCRCGMDLTNVRNTCHGFRKGVHSINWKYCPGCGASFEELVNEVMDVARANGPLKSTEMVRLRR